MEKNLIYSELLSIYKGLLTNKQVEALEYYYDNDYSLSEISEIMDISRQGVRDFIKRGEAVLDETEDKLHLVKKFRATSEIKAAADKIKKENKRLSESKLIDALSAEIIENVKLIEDGE